MNTYADRERIMAQEFLREFPAFYGQEIAPALAQLQAVNFSDGEPAIARKTDRWKPLNIASSTLKARFSLSA